MSRASGHLLANASLVSPSDAASAPPPSPPPFTLPASVVSVRVGTALGAGSLASVTPRDSQSPQSHGRSMVQCSVGTPLVACTLLAYIVNSRTALLNICR